MNVATLLRLKLKNCNYVGGGINFENVKQSKIDCTFLIASSLKNLIETFQKYSAIEPPTWVYIFNLVDLLDIKFHN